MNSHTNPHTRKNKNALEEVTSKSLLRKIETSLTAFARGTLVVAMMTLLLTQGVLPEKASAATRGPLVQTTPVTGAVITGETTVTLYVSNQETNGYVVGNDANDGLSKQTPLLTINEAARRANINQAGTDAVFTNAVGTKILINDGTYNEFIDWRASKKNFDTGVSTNVTKTTIGAPVPVVFEAENTGKVRIDGADTTRTTGDTTVSYATTATGDDAWQPATVGTYTAYAHRWVDEKARPINLGFFPNPFGTSATYGAIARRREMAFINNAQLKQVLCKDQLVPGTFYVSDDSMATNYAYPYPLTNSTGAVIDQTPVRPCTEATPDHQIYVVPFNDTPAGWSEATFSTTFRGTRVKGNPTSNPLGLPLEEDGSTFLFHSYAKSNFVLRGLTFVHATSKIAGSSSAVRFENSRNILVENTTIEYNNWIGIATYGINNPNPGQPFTPLTSGITIRNSSGSSNGGHGITATRMKNLVIEDSEFNRNNWRGDWAGLYNWDPGNKLMWVHDLAVRRSTFFDNRSHGLWLDTNSINATVEDNHFSGNRAHGLYIEASIGPILVRRNVFDSNGRMQSYPGIEGYGIFATFSNNVVLDGNIFYGNDIPLVIGGRTQYTHEPIGNSINFETGQSFANTAEDPRGLNWRIVNNKFATKDKTFLITLGIPLENFMNYLPWAAENNWTNFLDTLDASNNSYYSPITGGTAFNIQNPKTCLARGTSGACISWSTNPTFTSYTFDGWKTRTTQDTVGSLWKSSGIPNVTSIAGNKPGNPSFEGAGPSGVVTTVGNWTTTSGVFNRVTRVNTTENIHSGGWGVRMEPTTTSSVMTNDPITVVPGTTYLFSGYIYRSNSNGDTYIDLGDAQGDPDLLKTSDRANGWDFMERKWTAPAGVTSVTIRLVGEGGSETAPLGVTWFDDITFRQMP